MGIGASAITIVADIPRDTRNTLRDIATAALTAIVAAYTIDQYNKWVDEIEARDEMIDREEVIRNDLHRRDMDIDVPRLFLKQSVLGLSVPSANLCGDAVRYTDESEFDGIAVDEKAGQMADQSCDGIPNTWGAHEGSLIGSKAGSYAGGLLGNAGKRRSEDFRRQKTDLVLSAQQSARLDIGPVLQNLGQATAIHSGLADVFLSGFNSGASSLGVLAGQLANRNGSNGTVDVSNYRSNSGTGYQPSNRGPSGQY